MYTNLENQHLPVRPNIPSSIARVRRIILHYVWSFLEL